MINEYLRADIYDMDNDNYRSDLPFYLKIASKYVQPQGYILELGCGTGRVSIPLAKSGFNVIALDYSIQMLQRAKYKAGEQGVSDKISWVRGDMSNGVFDSEICDLVIIPFNSFQQILTKDRQYRALKNAQLVLKKGGAFLAEINIPTLHNGSLTSEKTLNLEGNKRLKRVMRSSSDPINQVVTRVFEYTIEDQFGSETICEDRNYFNIYPDQWEDMLIRTGYQIEHRFGDFNFNEFSISSKKMLFLCRYML